MALIVWDTRLETGHAKIDEQHQSMAEIFNRLHGAMKQGKGRAEEELMARHGYTGAARHRQIHADLVGQVAELVGKVQAGHASLTLAVMNFLEDWLVQHIQGEDYRMALEFKSKGIQ